MHSEKVPYYIIDLLQQVASVYVHGLGRFDAIFHPAVIDLQHSQIKPPFIEPGFVVEGHDAEHILSAYIHYVSGIGEEEARVSINEFVNRVHQGTESGENFTIARFGSFSKSKAGIIHFTPDWDAFNLSFIGLDVIDLYTAEATTTQEPEKHVVDTIPAPVPVESVIEGVPSETNWVTDREIPAPVTTHEEVIMASGTAISDSTSRLWWTILASALILITFLCAYLAWDIFSNRDKMNRYIAITNDTLETSVPDVIIIDTLDFIEEEIPSDTNAITKPDPEKVDPVANETPCFVVVGAFSNADNVVRMENRLKGLGYATELIKGGSLTRVAIRTDCDQATLQKTLNEARSAINPEAWVY